MGKIFKEVCIAIYMFLFSLIASILLVFNLTTIYKICINVFNIESLSGMSKELLMEDYNNVINYVTNPFIKKLELKNFPMSSQGEYHFFEVKQIVIFLEVIFIILLVLGLIMFLLYKKGKFKFPINSMNYLFYFTIISFSSILVLIYLDFSYVFDKFHEIIFNNDYWIFSPKTDPIINALPEEFFMVCGVFCILFVIGISVFSKIIYNKQKKKLIN